MPDLQIATLHKEFDILQQKYGDQGYHPIYGAGQIVSPKLMLIFMNPTGRNIASYDTWKGLRAPWLGTKQVWDLIHEISGISAGELATIKSIKADKWTEEFAFQLYSSIAGNQLYITNFAKCTLSDARPITNSVFQQYKQLLEEEIHIIKPQHIITFGNQVSTNLLSKNISVSTYSGILSEQITIKNHIYNVFPAYYPVGQGRRNFPLAKQRLLDILINSDTFNATMRF